MPVKVNGKSAHTNNGNPFDLTKSLVLAYISRYNNIDTFVGTYLLYYAYQHAGYLHELSYAT